MKYLFLIVLFSLSTLAQDPTQMVKDVQAQLDKVNDFKADISVDIDISYLNVPVKKGSILYKKPNKTKIDIDGFSFLPKQGIGNFVGEILAYKNLNIFLSGQEKVQNVDTQILTVIPNDQPNGIVLVRLWIDTSKNIVLQAEITTKDQGTFNIKMKYSKIDGQYFLPSETTIDFKIDNFSIPSAFVSAQDKQKVKKQISEGTQTNGTIVLTYSNYKVNKGINDSVFTD